MAAALYLGNKSLMRLPTGPCRQELFPDQKREAGRQVGMYICNGAPTRIHAEHPCMCVCMRPAHTVRCTGDRFVTDAAAAQIP